MVPARSVSRVYRRLSAAEAPIDANQYFIELTVHGCGRAAGQTRKEYCGLLRQYAVPLDEKRPAGREHPLTTHPDIKAAMGVAHTAKITKDRAVCGDGGLVGAPTELAVEQECRRDGVS